MIVASDRAEPSLRGGVLAWVQRVGGVDAWRAVRAARRHAALKGRVLRHMRAAGGYSETVGLTSRASIALALHMPASDVQLLLDELVVRGRIFRCQPPLPDDYYALVQWRPWSFPSVQGAMR